MSSRMAGDVLPRRVDVADQGVEAPAISARPAAEATTSSGLADISWVARAEFLCGRAVRSLTAVTASTDPPTMPAARLIELSAVHLGGDLRYLFGGLHDTICCAADLTESLEDLGQGAVAVGRRGLHFGQRRAIFRPDPSPI